MKKTLLAITLFTTIITLATISALVKAENAQIWTDKADYSPEETVIINGSGFSPDATITITVTRPDFSVDTWDCAADIDGNFVTTYQLDGITGTYTITATDETNTATTTFTDAIGINILDTSHTQHQNYPNRLQFGNIAQGTSLPFTVNIKVTGSYSSVTWQLRYATTDARDNSQLSPKTTGLPGSGTNTAPAQENPVSISIATSSLALGTYVGHLEAVRTAGDSPVGIGDFYFDFTLTTPPTVPITITSSPAGSGFVKVDGSTITTPQTFTWTIGDTHNLEALSPVADGANTQYVYTGWSDSGNQKHDITVPNTATTYTATYDTYFNVHYAANVPVTVPADEWVLSGGSATGVFTDPVISGGTKYVFVSDDRPLTITGPTTITATYDTYYWVTYAANVPVTLPASEWVKSGDAATGVFTDPVISGGTKYVFVSDDRPSKITAPTTITATYDTFYWVTYAANLPVTLPASEWVKSGQAATGVFVSPQFNVAGDTKYVFVEDDRPALITAPTTITATYQTLYKLTVSTNPSGLTPPPDADPTSPDGFYIAGTKVTLIANAVNLYTFNYWTVGGSNQGSGKDKIEVVMSEPRDAVAFYAPFTMNGYFTDSDFNPIDSFDCVFTPGTGTSYKMSATNPGTFYYNLKITNNGDTGTFTITIDIPKDFVLKPLSPGANPVQIDGKPVGYTISGSGNGLLTVSGVPINAGQTIQLTVHLDYALKLQYTSKSGYTATDQLTYHKGYFFPTMVNMVKGCAPTIAAAGKKVTAIGGFLTDSNGTPKGGLTVKVTDSMTTTSDSDGFYFIVVPTGSYTVKVYNSLSTPIATKTGVKVVQDQYLSVDFKNLSPADPAIEGFVTDSNGTPLAGVTVQLIGVNGRVIATTTTGAGGHYVFRFYAPGTYTVKILVPTGYAATTTSTTINIAQFQTATVNFSLTKK